LGVSSPDVAGVEIVVKVGGGLLAEIAILDAVLTVVAEAARSRRLLIVPGGGPFAEAVRSVDRRIALPDATAHWMAVLGMDQYAHLIAARLAGAVLVADPREIADGRDDRRIPVLMPSRWLRQTDPLPHSWDVTSDSIAAWVAGRVGARRLVLVKPRGVQRPDEAVDPYFARALPSGLTPLIIAADQIDALRVAFSSDQGSRSG
jgi:5-(aminomethyl)-3-furanmethanol phosphate kinase